MRTSEVDIIMVPGYGGSGPDHWQTRWQRRLSTASRVEQQDWSRPSREGWAARLREAVAGASRPVVLVAHSAGVPTVAHAAAGLQGVKGAFLVATPSEQAMAAVPGTEPAFADYPREPLPFPSLLVASRSDACCSYDEAAELALAWGSVLVDAGEAGHINTESGHGPWPEGLMRFAAFLARLRA